MSPWNCIILLLAVIQLTYASDYYVDPDGSGTDDGVCAYSAPCDSIGHVVNTTLGETDVVIYLNDGTHTLTFGPLNATLTSNLTVRSVAGDNPDDVIIECDGHDGLVSMGITLMGVTFQGCGHNKVDILALSEGAYTNYVVDNSTGDVHVEHVKFSNCSGSRGALSLYDNEAVRHNFTMRNVEFIDCYSVSAGGGMALTGPVLYDVENVSFIDCTAGLSGGAFQCGVFADSEGPTGTFRNITIEGAVATFGGGAAWIQYCDLDFYDLHISGSSTTFGYSAVSVIADSERVPTFLSGWITQNNGGNGAIGAQYLSPTWDPSNFTVTGNVAASGNDNFDIYDALLEDDSVDCDSCAWPNRCDRLLGCVIYDTPIYVDQSHTSAQDSLFCGDVDSPCLTISYVLDAFNPFSGLLIQPGTYRLTESLTSVSSYSLNVSSVSQDPLDTIIDCQGDYHAFTGDAMTISSLTITNCSAGGYNGAAYNQESSDLGGTSITNCIFSHNTAENGGALHLLSGANTTFSITDSVFSNNHATEEGGSIFVDDSGFNALPGDEPSVIDSVVITSSTADEAAGGIYAAPSNDISVIDTSITECTGGGIVWEVYSSNSSITGDTIISRNIGVGLTMTDTDLVWDSGTVDISNNSASHDRPENVDGEDYDCYSCQLGRCDSSGAFAAFGNCDCPSEYSEPSEYCSDVILAEPLGDDTGVCVGSECFCPDGFTYNSTSGTCSVSHMLGLHGVCVGSSCFCESGYELSSDSSECLESSGSSSSTGMLGLWSGLGVIAGLCLGAIFFWVRDLDAKNRAMVKAREAENPPLPSCAPCLAASVGKSQPHSKTQAVLTRQAWTGPEKPLAAPITASPAATGPRSGSVTLDPITPGPGRRVSMTGQGQHLVLVPGPESVGVGVSGGEGSAVSQRHGRALALPSLESHP